MDKSDKVVVRFPPSPTGLLHMGSVRTLLYNYFFAKKIGGKILLRIEDTDKQRSTKEFESSILDDIKWLGISFDNESDVWRQSERSQVYKEKIQYLIKKGSAYVSEETEGPNKQVVRFRNPGGKIKFQDLLRGEVLMDTGDLGDFIIARNIDDALYHLAVAVDDEESKITHVIRGDDGISNTPRQIMIIEALGGTRPIYAHLPLILAPDKSKLSKRKHGEMVSLKYFRDQCYEKEAVINFLSLVGWNPGGEEEIFSIEELISKFDISKVQKKGGVFNIEKFNWINKKWIARQSKEAQVESLKAQVQKSKWSKSEQWQDKNFLENFLAMILERIHRWGEVCQILDSGELDYFFEVPLLDLDKLPWKNQNKDIARENLEKICAILSDTKDFSEISKKIEQLTEQRGKGEILWPLRYSLSGKEKSTDPLSIIRILGPEDALLRLKAAIEMLNK